MVWSLISEATRLSDWVRCMSDTRATDALPDRFVIAECAVVAGDELRYHERGFVVVERNRILDVGEGSGPAELPRIELPDRLIVPGYLNGHTHVGDAGLKELGFGSPPGTNLLWQPNGLRFQHMGAMSREERIAGMRGAVMQMIAAGTVLFADFREGGAAGVEELLEACSGLPIRPLVFGRLATNPVFTVDEFAANSADLPAEAVREIERILEVADGYSPVWANELTDPALTRSARMARDAGRRLATHACETPLYRSLSRERTGRGDVERVLQHLEPDFVVHMTSATDTELDLVVDAGLPMIMCPRSQEGLGTGLPPVAAAWRKGATLGFGTDNVMLTTPEVLAEAQYYALAARGRTGDTAIVDSWRLLASSTIDTARALGVDSEFGSISPGKSAHLVCYDMSRPNLRYSRDPIATIVTRATPADIEVSLFDGQPAVGSLPAPVHP